MGLTAKRPGMDGSTELGVWGELLEQKLVDFGGAHLERREPWRPRAHTRAPGAAVVSRLRGSERAALSTLSETPLWKRQAEEPRVTLPPATPQGHTPLLSSTMSPSAPSSVA